MGSYNLTVLGGQFFGGIESLTLASVLMIVICTAMVEVSGGFSRMRPLLKAVLGCRDESPVWRIMAHWNRYGISLAVSIMLFGFIFEQGIMDLMNAMLMPVSVFFLAAAVFIRLWETVIQKRQGMVIRKTSGAEWKSCIKDGLPVLILALCAVYFIRKREYIVSFACFCTLYGLIMAVCYLPRNLKNYWNVLELTLTRIAFVGAIWGINAVYTRCVDQFDLMGGVEELLFGMVFPLPLAVGVLLLCAIAVLASAVFGMIPVILVYAFPMTLVAYSMGAGAVSSMSACLISVWLGNAVFVYRMSRRSGEPAEDEAERVSVPDCIPVTEEPVGGYLAADIKNFLAPNEQYYIGRFQKLCGEKVRFNLCAMLLGENWFAYKGMWAKGILFCLINSALGTIAVRQYEKWEAYGRYGRMPVSVILPGIIGLGAAIWIGMNADKLYWKHITKKLDELNHKDSEAEDDGELRSRFFDNTSPNMINILLMGLIRLTAAWLFMVGFR